MAPEICTKDPNEVTIYTFNFTDKLNSGATISTISSVAGSPSGLTFASNTILSGNLKISTLISSGTHATDYTVTATVTTSDGETLEESGILQVRNSSS